MNLSKKIRLSIIIPVFNEEKTILQIIEKVKKVKFPIASEIIIVDDGSKDLTREKLKKVKEVKIILHEKNQGKGEAVKTGIKNATGEYIIIQDADLEYDPNQINDLLMPILQGSAKVVYGTRLKRLPDLSNEERTPQFLIHYFGNRFLSLITSILYGQWITDMETCYKLFPKNALDGAKLNAKGFEFEPEITAKLLKKGFRIFEVPIATKPRGYDEGKKINTVRDGIRAFITLIKYRFAS